MIRTTTTSAALLALGVTTATAGMFLTAGAAAAAPAPKGDNGTVKVAGADADAKGNDPHLPCTFKVEWIGFDKSAGSAHVSFALQAPTAAGRTMTVQGPSSLTVNGDASATYTLGFTGDPQQNQGYHVRMDIDTAGAGKSKVVWIDESC